MKVKIPNLAERKRVKEKKKTNIKTRKNANFQKDATSYKEDRMRKAPMTMSPTVYAVATDNSINRNKLCICQCQLWS